MAICRTVAVQCRLCRHPGQARWRLQRRCHGGHAAGRKALGTAPGSVVGKPACQRQARGHGLAGIGHGQRLLPPIGLHLPAGGGALQPDIGRHARQPARRAFHRPAELGWQARQVLGRIQRLLQGLAQRMDRLLRPAQRVDHQIAAALTACVGVQQAHGRQGAQHGGVPPGRNAAQLHIGAAGQLQRAVAMHPCQPRQPPRLGHRQAAQRRAHAQHQPIAGGHGLPGAGAPALDVGRGMHGFGAPTVAPAHPASQVQDPHAFMKYGLS